MTPHKLAPVRWYLGQTLMPEHLQAHEEALLSEQRLLREVWGLPVHGVARLSWNEALLGEGTLSLADLTVVFPGGRLLDVPGNATIPPFSLKSAGTARVSVYLHLLPQTATGEGIPRYQDDPAIVQRTILKATLSAEEALPESLATIKLMEMKKDPDGTWVLGRRYLPPLCQIGPSPFLRQNLEEMAQTLDIFRAQLQAQLQDSFLRLERIFGVRRALVAVQQLQGLLLDIKHGVHRHPYHLYEALRTFYFELCCHQEALPEREAPPYLHNDLGKSFYPLLQLTLQIMRMPRGRSMHRPFVRREGLFLLSPLPGELAAAQEAYVLLQRTQIHHRVSLDGVKLASPSRLSLVYKLALKGIPLAHVPNPLFSHSFGPEVDFYQVGMGEEWNLALKEDALAFYIPPSLSTEAAARVSLFWR